VAKTKFAPADDLFRQLVKEIRLAKGLTQIDLSSRLGQPQSYVSKYETGERRLDFVETVLVCRALGVEIEDFAATFSDRLRKAGRQGH
jgi:transcriptional regulator with XRE-family HTH domain